MNHTQAKETLEIMRTRLWHVDPRFAHQVRPTIEAYLNRQAEEHIEENRHASGWFALKSQSFKNHAIIPEEIQAADGTDVLSNDLIVTDDPKWDMTQHWWDEEGPLISPDDQFINVIDMTSSVTRCGGWCSSGSIEHRDQMIFASKFPNCIGHLFIIDTPGGSAYSKNDYEQGIAAARAAGQPVVCWIDGMCCSAGVAAACQTDEIYVQHPNCEVGCIGTMAAFYTLADGTQDEDGYVYHELYDPESFEKNLEFRELANNGNADPILEDLAEDGAEFRALVKSHRPAMEESMLHGKVFKARDLMGKLVDGVKSYEDVISRLVAINEGEQLLKHEAAEVVEEPEAPEDPEEDPNAPEVPEEPEDKCGDKDKDDKCGDDKDKDDKCGDKDKDDKCGDGDKDDKCGDGDKDKDNATVSVNTENTLYIMNKYNHLTKAMGLAENQQLAATEEGFYCNNALAEAADAFCAEAEQTAVRCKANEEALGRANEQIASLNAEIENLNGSIEEKDNTIAELNGKIAEAEANASTAAEEADTDKGMLNEQIEALEAEKAELTASSEAKDAEIASLKEQLASKEAELEEMSKAQAQAPTPAPADNSSKETTKSNAARFYSESMTSEERRKACEARMAHLRSI